MTPEILPQPWLAEHTHQRLGTIAIKTAKKIWSDTCPYDVSPE